MDNFDVFNKILEEYEESFKIAKDPSLCLHINVVIENSLKICSDCGEELVREIFNNKEWRYYSKSDIDPSRCHIRKFNDKSIYKDVENMGFNEKVVKVANDIYMAATKGKIARGDSRKAMIFICIFHAYKLLGNPQSCTSLCNMFELDRRMILKGLKQVSLNSPKNSEIRVRYITPVEIIDDIIEKLDDVEIVKEDVIELYNKIKDKSSLLNRSRPQSIAASLIYVYLCNKRKDTKIKEYVKKVGLSEITINKISKQINKIVLE